MRYFDRNTNLTHQVIQLKEMQILMKKKVEYMIMIVVDEEMRYTIHALARGNSFCVFYNTNKVFDIVQNQMERRGKECGVILLHNHPSFPAMPSSGDIKSHNDWIQRFNNKGIEYIDNIVVCGDGGFTGFSLRENGYL